jgi:cysteine-rich repeat protein
VLTRLLASACGVALCITLLSCANKPSSAVCSSGIVCPSPLQCAAVQAVCITNDCGNGIVDPGEECDDGNILNGDGCSATCLNEGCGNGVVDPGELCDDGNTSNGACTNGGSCDTDSDCPGTGNKCVPDKCSKDCKSLQVCGNGIVDFDEICDDGNTFDGTCPNGTPCNADADCAGIGSGWCAVDGCAKDCLSNESCGNGVVDLNEVCDNGSANAVGASCEPGCLSGSGCGNGVIDPGETCDDGNLNDNDDCPSGTDLAPSQRCQIARCGDGITDSSGSDLNLFEQCDPGAAGETSSCNPNCTTATCGDGIVNPLYMPDGTHGEQCDLGSGGLNNKNADCTDVCLVNVCGDGDQDTQLDHFEQCDDGSNNGSGSDMCDTQCKTVSCGNGLVEENEQCDLGSGSNGSNSSCPFCKLAVCGDGLVETGVEQCDQGAGNNGSNTACPFCRTARCGDGFTETAGNVEQCDDGGSNGKPGDTCDFECKTVACGNGIVEQGEQCDTGNKNTDTKTCNGSACTFSICGDGLTNTVAGEACDDGSGNGKPGDTCNASCQLVHCGNGVIEQGEECDGANLGSASCTTLGYGQGTLTCAAGTCQFDVSGCGAFCGNDIIEGDEECDGSNVGSATCKTLGFGGGTLSCTSCSFNTSLCTAAQTCGNGKAEGTEQCDESDYRGLTCLILGFKGDALSALSCYGSASGSACELDTKTCNECADGDKDDGETDVDCGGPCSANCAYGKGCSSGTDCTSGLCLSSLCACSSNSDCSGGFCDIITHQCTANECSDGSKDGNETDVDCGGGTCPACGTGSGCKHDSDCISGDGCSTIAPIGECELHCDDGHNDGNETGVDCGGPTCSTCDDGQACGSDGDCTNSDCGSGSAGAGICGM